MSRLRPGESLSRVEIQNEEVNRQVSDMEQFKQYVHMKLTNPKGETVSKSKCLMCPLRSSTEELDSTQGCVTPFISNLQSCGYPARTPGVIRSDLGLFGPVNVHHDRHGKFDMQLLSQWGRRRIVLAHLPQRYTLLTR